MYRLIGVAFLGICFGVVIAGGFSAFLISLGIIPRYAGITRTGKNIGLYEDTVILGTIIGTLCYFYQGNLHQRNLLLIFGGIFAGIFLGSWIIALEEIVNIFPVITRRTGLTKGIGWIVATMALGKTLGSLLYFWKGW